MTSNYVSKELFDDIKKRYAKSELECYQLKQDRDNLKQENSELKQMVNSPSITFTTCPECGKKYSINYCREVHELKQENEKLKSAWEELYLHYGVIPMDSISLALIMNKLSKKHGLEE